MAYETVDVWHRDRRIRLHRAVTFQQSGTLTFAPGETSKTIVISTIEDSESEVPETFTVRLSSPRGGATLGTAAALGTIIVNDSQRAPVLAGIGNKTVDEETLLSFTATATDPDLPANGLTFSLIGAPAGASIDRGHRRVHLDADRGAGAGQLPGDRAVTDNGPPNLFDEESITITVNEVNVAPVLASHRQSDGQ